MSQHCRFAPSSAARTVACPGSVALIETTPINNRYQTEIDEGDAAHWLAAQTLRRGEIGPTAPNGVTINDEMRDAVGMYVKCVNKHRDNLNALPVVVEEFIQNDRFHEDNGGTPDAWVFDGFVLTILDFKYGHDFVDAYRNWQLINYAGLIIRELGLDADIKLVVEFVIVQPRNYHRSGPIRKWKVRAVDLRPLFNILKGAFEDATTPSAPLRASSECCNCPAQLRCPAFIEAGQLAITQSLVSLPLEMTPRDKGLLLRGLIVAKKMLDEAVDTLSADVLSSLTKGEDVPFFHVERSLARRSWIAPADSLDTLSQIFEVKLREDKFITPAQAIKIGIPADVVAQYSHQPVGAAKLEMLDDHTVSKIFEGN